MKTILITGCNGGIGIEICKYFKSLNFIVIGIDITSDENIYVDKYFKMNLNSLKKNMKDIFIFNNLIHHIENVCNKKIDLLINNAAIQIKKDLIEMDDNEMYQIFNTNLIAPALLIKYLIPYLKGGCVINIGSIHSNQTKNKFSIYASSKGGLKSLTKALSVELSPDIRVNMIEPAAIDTDMLKEYLSDNEYKNLKEYHPTKTIGNPNNISSMIYEIYNNKFINGSIISIDGGISNVLFDPETEV